MKHSHTPATKRARLPEGPFYRELGQAIRANRITAGKTQAEIAEHLDITITQYQKYEAGKNRIPLDRLVKVAEHLKLPLSHFISSGPYSGSESALHSLIGGCSSKEFRRLLEIWTSVSDRRLRAKMLDLVNLLATDQQIRT